MSDSPRIVFLDASTVDAGDVEFGNLSALGEFVSHRTTDAEEIDARLEGAAIAITNKVVVDEQTISRAAPNLKLIVVSATGYNNVDLDAARAHGVTVCNVVGYSTPSTAQHAFSLLLNLATNIHHYAAESDQWPESPIFTRLAHPIVELDGLTLGIAGAGNIGCRVAEMGVAFGMDIQILARPGSLTAKHPEWPRVDSEEFYATSDAISLHCPLTDDTQHMINPRTLRLMKPTAFLVNTGRGPLVDEAALAAALRERRLAGAALDVLSEEPPPADHPLLAKDIPNLLVTPHTAWASRDARWRLLDAVAHNIRSFLADTPANRVD